jgi:hypothetical protein
MEKLQAYGAIFLGCLSCFTYGIYAASTAVGREIEPHRWVLTGLFGIGFLVYGLKKYKEL